MNIRAILIGQTEPGVSLLNFFFKLLQTIEECDHCLIEFTVPEITNTSRSIST